MLHMPLFHFCRILEKLNQVLDLNNGTFLLKGPWFSSTDILLTSDPANVHHIMSTNFLNYPKGSESKRIFDVFGERLFNSDLDEWKKDRKLAHAFFNDERFHKFSPKVTRNTLEKGLIPVLEHVSEQGLIVDLQDLFLRFMLDTTCMVVTGHDPGSLRTGFPEVEFSRSLDEISQAIYLRLILPERIWKLRRRLRVGEEKKLSKARKTLDEIVEKYITIKQQQLSFSDDDDQESFDTLKCFLTKDEIGGSIAHPYGTIRDTIIGLTYAGRDTTSAVLTWFFWLISGNPFVESKIREELEVNLSVNEEEKCRVMFNKELLNKLTYIHGSLCETLRLYPPIPFQCRAAVQGDILPSGHNVGPNMNIVICSYAMGRMKSIWEEDCLKFKPERWITERGVIKVEPSNKFQVFSSGPRICPGRELAFTRMKAVAATIIHNYHVQVVKSEPATPVTSIILHMKDGLKVRVSKR